MFGKKTCSECGEKVSRRYDFCPYCGNAFGNEKAEDYGMLGMDDELERNDAFSPFESLFGKMSGSMFNKLFGNAVKMLEKELEKEFRNQGQNQNINQAMPQRTNFEIIINGKRVNPESIRFTQRIMQPDGEVRQKKKSNPKMSEESLKKISKLVIKSDTKLS